MSQFRVGLLEGTEVLIKSRDKLDFLPYFFFFFSHYLMKLTDTSRFSNIFFLKPTAAIHEDCLACKCFNILTFVLRRGSQWGSGFYG